MDNIQPAMYWKLITYWNVVIFRKLPLLWPFGVFYLIKSSLSVAEFLKKYLTLLSSGRLGRQRKSCFTSWTWHRAVKSVQQLCVDTTVLRLRSTSCTTGVTFPNCTHTGLCVCVKVQGENWDSFCFSLEKKTLCP